ncbi:MAG: hypothetical protein Q8L90_01685 [Bacteroidota bacterium]|nr:hypothetical protein [Bacteroidota bacterium]
MKDKTTNGAIIVLVVGIILVLIAPYIFTRSGYLSFEKTGTIGDTIGGITAPITSLIGSILVFFALKAQIDANRLIQIQFADQKLEEEKRKSLLYISEQINIVRNDINEFSFTFTESSTDGYGIGKKQKFNFTGADAINEFLENIKTVGEGSHGKDPFIENPKLTELHNLLVMTNSLFDSITNGMIDTNDKTFYKSLLAYQFTSKVKPGFDSNEKWSSKHRKPCETCKKKHMGIPEILFDLVETISMKAK